MAQTTKMLGLHFIIRSLSLQKIRGSNRGIINRAYLFIPIINYLIMKNRLLFILPVVFLRIIWIILFKHIMNEECCYNFHNY